MYRFLLKPRWLALVLAAVLAVVVCLLMGFWQLDRFNGRVADDRALQKRPEQAAAAIGRVLGPGGEVGADDVNRSVLVRGRYDTRHQLLVPGREVHGRTGYFVLTPLRPEGGGRAVPVVRGWQPSAKGAPAAPGGTVTVRGTLRAPESDDSPGVQANVALPAGQVGMIAGSTLVNVLPYHVVDAWVTAEKAPAGMVPVPVEKPENGGLDARAFQNLGYTGEWFVFAGFAVFMVFRFVRREGEAQRDRAMGLLPGDEDGPDGGGSGGGGSAPGDGSGGGAEAGDGAEDGAREPRPVPA